MAHTLNQLSDGGRQELALALLLWKDFKCQGKLDLEIYLQAVSFAEMLGVKDKFEELMKKLPPMKIELRYK